MTLHEDEPMGGLGPVVGSELWDHLSDGLLLVEGERILNANRAAQQLFGYPEHVMRQLTVDELVPAPFRDEHRRLRHDFGTGGDVRPMDPNLVFEGLAADGSILRLAVGLIPLSHGRQRRTLVVLRALTPAHGPAADGEPLTEADRERLIQTLYAAGLLLRGSGPRPGVDASRSAESVEHVIEALDSLIADLAGHRPDRAS